jgi:hypothetical protein
MKNKILIITSWISILSALIVISVATFWLVFPYNPLEIRGVNVLDKEVRAGGFLKYEIDYCKYTDNTSDVTRAFINGIIFTTPSITTNNPLGCHKNVHQIVVPSELPSGEYALRTVWTYQINPLRKVSVSSTTDKFMVTGSDLDRQQDQN